MRATKKKKKNRQHSTYWFGDNYLANNIEKFLQDKIKPWKVGALRVSTGYQLFKKKFVSGVFITYLSS